MWTANPLWAFPWYTAIAGCPVERDGDIVWALPALDDLGQLDRVRFDPANPWFCRLLEFTAALLEHGRGRYTVGMGLAAAPGDLMMQLRGQDRLPLDLFDAPELVTALGECCVDFVANALDAHYAAVPRHLGGYAGTLRYFWAPDRLVESAEDLSFMLSPAMHRRFVVPLHRRLGRRYPHNIVHLHSAQLHTVATLLEVEEIAAIEITPDFGADMLPHLPTMAKILQRKPLLVHGIVSVDAAKEMIRTLPSCGFALFFRCDSPAEASATLDTVLG